MAGGTTTTMDVRRVSEGPSVIDIGGDVTAASEDVLMDAYAQVGEGARAVILNFSGLEYMNSGGIGLLVTLLVRTNRQRQRLLAFGLTDHYREIFELTRLDEAVEIHANESDALAAAGVPIGGRA
ncbi:MAG: STAS domain-containing protein [Thermoleophilaceae bacterium]|nr:STAS domain-containing protein [Thermoleophilaceae bacterium]